MLLTFKNVYRTVIIQKKYQIQLLENDVVLILVNKIYLYIIINITDIQSK